MTRTSDVNRRRFLEIGALGVGYGFVAPHANGAQSNRASARETGTVRMIGDGLGLTPGETARIWTDLAANGDIVPDSYSNGGSVEQLEAKVAKLLGKERAIFMPTGTLANHLAVRALAGGRGRAVVQAESHLYNDSGDCVQTLSNMPLIPLAAGRGSFTLEELEGALERTGSGRVATSISVISIETPIRRLFGETFDARELGRIVKFAKHHNIRLHLDGARVFLQSAYEGRAVAEYTAPFDTVYVSLYKYFNAPSGAVLAGSQAMLAKMYHTRRMFGAGLPAAWPFAAIAHHYLAGFVDRFRQAIDNSEAWVKQIERHEAFTVTRIPNGTNLLRLKVARDITRTETFRRRLRGVGITIGTPRADGSYLIGVNETWNRRSADELADLFVTALG